MNKQGIVYLLLVVAIALQVSAISTDHWSCHKDTGITMHIGLWKMCMDVPGGTKCSHAPPEGVDAKGFPKNSLYAVRAFAILGVLLVAFSLVCAAYLKGNNKCQVMCLVGGAVCSIIANIIWAAELLKFGGSTNDAIKADPGYSFYLNLSGGLVALLAAGYQYSA